MRSKDAADSEPIRRGPSDEMLLQNFTPSAVEIDVPHRLHRARPRFTIVAYPSRRTNVQMVVRINGGKRLQDVVVLVTSAGWECVVEHIHTTITSRLELARASISRCLPVISVHGYGVTKAVVLRHLVVGYDDRPAPDRRWRDPSSPARSRWSGRRSIARMPRITRRRAVRQRQFGGYPMSDTRCGAGCQPG
jgi:hypothetical protein